VLGLVLCVGARCECKANKLSKQARVRVLSVKSCVVLSKQAKQGLSACLMLCGGAKQGG